MNQLIIMMSGEARAGKDTSADILSGMIAELGLSVCRTYFAKALKESVKAVFSMTDEHVYGELKETPMTMRLTQQDLYRGIINQLTSGHLKFIPKKLNQKPIHIIARDITLKMLMAIMQGSEWVAPCVYNFSPRQIMQWWGTEAVRVGAYDSAWIDAVDYDMVQANADVSIISDARFDNEVIVTRENNLQVPVITINVSRGNKQQVAKHVSEAGLSKNLITYEVSNNGSIQDLADALRDVLFDKEILSGGLKWLDN